MQGQRFVSAIFEDEPSANDAVHALTEAGFPSQSISVLALADGRIEDVPLEERPTGKEGALAGGLIGATLGAVGGAMVAAGAITLPGASVVVAAGPLAAALKGGVFGAAAGGASGGLRALSVWETEADFPASELEPGTIVVGASTSEEHVETAREALEASPGRKLEVKESAAEP